MGMYDTVEIQCPACEAVVRVQSTAGPCVLAEYRLDQASEVVVRGLVTESEEAGGWVCGNGHRVQVRQAMRLGERARGW